MDPVKPIGTLLSRKEYAVRYKFGGIAIWNGSEWISDYKWDCSNCHDFGTHKALMEFVHKCIFEEMAKIHCTARYGTTTIEQRVAEFNCTKTEHFNNVDRSALP